MIKSTIVWIYAIVYLYPLRNPLWLNYTNNVLQSKYTYKIKMKYNSMMWHCLCMLVKI